MKKKCFVLKISRFLCFYEIHRFQNLWCHHRHCYIMEIILMLTFSFNPKYYQNETWSTTTVLYMANICNMFLAQFWRQEKSYRPFYYFIKMTRQWDLAIFNCWHLPFSIVALKNETLEPWHNWVLSNWSSLLNWKGPGNWTAKKRAELM